MGTTLTGLTPSTTYDALIKVGDNGPIDGTLKTLSDGLGNDLPIEVSTAGVNLTGSPTVNSVAIANTTQVAAKQDTLVSGTNIKTINGTSVLGSGNITTPNVSGVAGAIQFSNGSAFASDATNFFWDNTTKRLGVGTNNPQDRCEVNGNIRVGASSFVYSSAGGGAVTSGIYLDSSTSKVSVYTNSAERVIFGASTVATIKGSGSTSATTSLLVQNSASTQNMKVTDDGRIIAGADSSGMKYRSGTGLDLGQVGNSGAGGGWVIQMWDNDLSNRYAYFSTIGVQFGNNLTGYTNASAALSADSTTKGFLPPRMTTTQKNAIASPAAGLVVYDNTTNKLQCYNGSTWNDLF